MGSRVQLLEDEVLSILPLEQPLCFTGETEEEEEERKKAKNAIWMMEKKKERKGGSKKKFPKGGCGSNPIRRLVPHTHSDGGRKKMKEKLD